MKFFKVFALLLAGLFLTVGGRAFAAEADMQAFRAAYLQGMTFGKGYHLELMFHGPTFQSNVIADGYLQGNGAAVATGRLTWGYTDLTAGQTQQHEMPFYAERSGDAVTFYGQRNAVWEKESILGSLSWILDAVSSEDSNTKQSYAAAVKDVQVSETKNGQQRINITFDGQALSAVKDKAVRDRIANMSDADRQEALVSLDYLNRALAANNLQCTWTIDKATGETAMLTADLTEVMRSYAKAVLDDSYQGKISLSQEETDFLASIGYYYNLQLYLTRKDTPAQQVVIPAGVKSGAQDNDIFADIEREVISVAKK